MHSSTFSSDRAPRSSHAICLIAGAVLAVLAVAAYEASLRAVAARPGIVASAGLWARQVQRSLADEHPDVTVVLGASRAMSGFSSSVFRHRHPDVPIYFLTLSGHGPVATFFVFG